MYDLDYIAQEFPILKRLAPNGSPLIYLDSAATALKPQCVIDAVSQFLCSHTANIHRSVHFLGDEATEAFEGVRETVAYFLNAEPNEIIFVKNSIKQLHEGFSLTNNQVQSLHKISKGDELVQLKMLLALYRRAKPIAELQANKKANFKKA